MGMFVIVGIFTIIFMHWIVDRFTGLSANYWWMLAGYKELFIMFISEIIVTIILTLMAGKILRDKADQRDITGLYNDMLKAARSQGEIRWIAFSDIRGEVNGQVFPYGKYHINNMSEREIVNLCANLLKDLNKGESYAYERKIMTRDNTQFTYYCILPRDRSNGNQRTYLKPGPLTPGNESVWIGIMVIAAIIIFDIISIKSLI